MTKKRTIIVVVDDEPDTAEMFAEMMRLRGYEVCKSYGGESAKQLIEETIPDVVVLDVMMPDVSGLDVLKWIRAHDTLSGTPVVMVSAKSLPEDVEAGIRAGATVYLSKPVAYQDIVEAVSKALS
jgi:two-component system OmpR family response regulator